MAAEAPVVPVGLVGTDRVQPIGATVPRVHRVRIAFGPPVRPEDYADLPPGRARRQITDAVMESVAALTGQPLAGGYNDHATGAPDDRRSA
jgi:1-acyl-sn-glycerol-3-phosphate acyltransferase